MNLSDEKKLGMVELDLIKRNLVIFRVADETFSHAFKLSEDKTAIAFHKNNPDIVIYLQALSTLPQVIRKSEPFMSFVNKNTKVLNSIGLPSDVLKQLGFLRENLPNKLIVAAPILKENSYYETEIPYYYNYEMVHISDDISNSESYITIPSVVSHIDLRRFESMLQSNNPIVFSNYNGMMSCPEFIVCEKILYQIPSEALLPNDKNISSFISQDSSLIKRMQIPTDFNESSKCTWQGLHFLPLEYAQKLRIIFNTQGKLLKEELPISIKASYSNEKESNIPVQPIQLVQEGQLTEYGFLQVLKSGIYSKNLYYDEKDLYNFHTALKTNFLTILGGMSGTGKTQLALEYARALNLIVGEDLLIIPISPSYTEPSDLLGYLNVQTGIFNESETGLTRFLINASMPSNQNRLFMIIFDEMNLSQVEYWFSPFISILELSETERKLRLVSERQHCLLEEYRQPIPIGNNVILVGTANFDETTKEFSSRLLDRANLINLNKQTFLNAKNVKEEIEVPDYIKVSAKTFRGWVKPNNSNPLQLMDDKELSLLDELHKVLSKIDPQNGVSFRVCKAIANYISNIPEDENGKLLIARRSAFDIQLRQRVFTKIKGHKEMLNELLGNYRPDTDEVGNGIIIQLLESYDDDKEKVFENFEQSLIFLKQKAKELVIHGYTM